MEYTIYGLTDEHGLIRYVGQTVNCTNRFRNHVTRPPKPFHVSGFAILQTVQTYLQANRAEQRWIRFFGRENLLNGNDGGLSHLHGSAMNAPEFRVRRYIKRLTVQALAKKIGVSVRQVHRWERGHDKIPASVTRFVSQDEP